MKQDNTNVFFIIKNAFGPLSLSLDKSVEEYNKLYLSNSDSNLTIYWLILLGSCINYFWNICIYLLNYLLVGYIALFVGILLPMSMKY